MPEPETAPVANAAPAVRPRRVFGWAAALLGIAIVLALLAAFVFHRLETGARDSAARLESWAGRVRDAFVAVAQVQPRVTVKDRVVFEQTSPRLELAVVSRQAVVEREFTKSWLGSTKRLRLRGEFEVKAGFDLSGQTFAAQIGDVGGEEVVKIQLPPARLLSVEQRHVEVLEQKNGLWNRLGIEELGNELNALAEQARQKALRADLPREAEETLARQLRERLGPNARRVEITTVPPPGPVPAP